MTDIIFTDGGWSPVYKYYVYSDDGDTIIYHLKNVNTSWLGPAYGVKYVRSTLLWSDDGVSQPNYLTDVNDYSTVVSGASVYNPVNLVGFDINGTLNFVFENPHWEDPNTTVTEGDGIPQLDVLDVSPAILTRLAGEAGGIWSDELSYRYCGSASNFHVYDLWSSYSQNWSANEPRSLQHSIKVDYDPTSATFNTWSDNGDQNPTSVTDDGTNVYLSTVYAFVKPVIILTPPPPPPPSPIFVPRSARRGNLNFW